MSEIVQRLRDMATVMVDGKLYIEAADKIEALEKVIRGCQWYWPAEDQSSDACEYSEYDVVNSAYDWDGNFGHVVEVSNGGVVETTFCAFLPAAADSDGDDEFWVQETTKELAETKIAAEILRRETLEQKS